MNRLQAHTLICAAQLGDITARNELITYYCQSLIPGLAASWGKLDFDEACAIANLATVEAVDAALLTYNPEQQAGIAAYVRLCVVRALSLADYQLSAVQGPARRSEHTVDVPLTSINEPCEPTANPEQLAIQTETRDLLDAAFETMLSPRASRIMRGLYFEGLDARQIANQLQETEAHISYIRSTALKVLRSNPAIRTLL